MRLAPDPIGSDCFEPPFDGPVEREHTRFPLFEGHRAGLAVTYREGTTDILAFAVYQSTWHEGAWQEVFRIDSWHGAIHRHDFTRTGDNHVTTLEVLPDRSTETVKEVWRNQAEDLIMTEWGENYRRWRGDPE